MTLISRIKRLFNRPTRSTSLAYIEERYQISIQEPAHYTLAFTHRSAGNGPDNERLEFLGDTVLDMVIAEYLYTRYPDMDEGRLTKLKSKMVSRESLSRFAQADGLCDHVVLKKQKDLEAGLIIGNVMEALFGAVYLDQGFEVAHDRIIQMIERNCDPDELLQDLHDPKSRLLEWSQRVRKKVVFSLQALSGGDFRASVIVNGEAIATGEGSSKKRAEKSAARYALCALDIELHDSIV